MSATSPEAAADDIAVEASLKVSGLGNAEAKDDNIVPVIDLSSTEGTANEAVVAELFKAATEVGFFSVIGHGINQSIIDEAFHESREFFQQPLEMKRAQSPLDMKINCGYEYFSQVRPSTGVADQKESLQITARENAMDGRWPNQNLKASTMSLLNASHELANRLLDLLEPMFIPRDQSQKIPTASPGTISKSHTLWSPDGQCTLRMLHYPPQDKEKTAKLLQEGYWRAGPHTDWCNLTLLYQRPGQAGLECCANPRTTGDSSQCIYWTKVNPVEGAIAVNIGDMLARWSDGKLYSNLHRVRLPRDATHSRYSIAYFAQSDKSTLIESKTHASITAGNYILSRIQSNFESVKAHDAGEDGEKI